MDCLEWLLEEFKPELAQPSVLNQATKVYMLPYLLQSYCCLFLILWLYRGGGGGGEGTGIPPKNVMS